MRIGRPDPNRRNASRTHRFEASFATVMAAAVGALVYCGLGGSTPGQMSIGVIAFPLQDDLVAIVAILALIAVNAMFAAGETAIDVLRPMHVRHLQETGDAHAGRVERLVENQSQYVATCIFGSHFVRVAMVLVGFLLAQGLALRMAGWTGWKYDFNLILLAAAIVAVPVMLLNLIVAELVPKSYASLHPVRTARSLYRFLRASSVLFVIPAKLVAASAGLLTARFGGRATFAIANQAEQEILTIVETAEESGEIEVDEKKLLHSVFEFTDTVAREVMTPRVDLDAMPVQSDPKAVVEMIHETGHSRIPLYEDNDDQIVGIIHAKDLLMATVDAKRQPTVRELMRSPLFVPENKDLHDLLAEMRQTRNQMAVVQDEFGGTSGIVTIEDIVEELVGDIVDEYDVDEPEIERIDDGFLIDGKTHVDDVSRELGAEIESEEFDTIGGYVFGLFGRQPRQGESIDADGYRFTVAESDGRRIAKLKVERLATANDDAHALDARD